MRRESDELQTFSSPSDTKRHFSGTTSSQKTRVRNPLESLSSFVNSLEIKAVSSKISNSALSIRKSVSHRFADLPLFPTDDTSDDFDDENESTLNDEEWLASPSSKNKTTSPAIFHNAAGSTSLSPAILHDVLENTACNEQFTSNEHLPNTLIKTYTVPQDNLPRIDEGELQKIIDGIYADQFDEFVIIDCRFPYEFEGGHISSAINVSSPQDLEEQFLREPNTQSSCRRLLVFHCEYSLLRGPTLATHLRKVDRHVNAHCYPHLHYPDIVVLDRGYKGFFDKFRHLCEPQGYVAMKDSNHKRTCDVEMSKVIQASKLTRAKSFNQFPSRLNLLHSRSASLTALLTSSELSNPANTAPMIRSRRSLKIKKRERKDPRPQFTQSLSNFSNASVSPPKDSPIYSRFDHDDFLPPTALFKNQSKSSSGSILSVDSSSSSICSESLSPSFLSSDSLSESASPFYERHDSYTDYSAYDSIDVVTPLPSINNYHVNQDSSTGGVLSSEDMSSNCNAMRPCLTRPALRLNIKPENSTPNFSSPLSLGTKPAIVPTPVPSHINQANTDSQNNNPSKP